MSLLKYPNADTIFRWAIIVGGYENLSKFLPATDENWARLLEADFQLCQMHPDAQNMERSAARLFYRIIKNHHFVDGNKRSAVICLYLFLFLNEYDLSMAWQDLYGLARAVAEKTQKSEEVIDWIASLIASALVKE